VFDKKALIESLSKNDFMVSVNKKVVEISSFESVKRMISNPTTPFRNFILSFNLYDYGEQVNEGIEYFVRNILTDNDEMMIFTPENVHIFSTDAPKDKIIDDIKKLVKQDCRIFKAKRTIYKNSFKEKLGTTRLGIAPEVSTKDTALRFINSYRSEWLTFKNRFLIPDVNRYKLVSEYFYGKDGDKWFINFQQREIIPELGELRKKIRELRILVSSLAESEETGWGPMISKGIRDLEISLLLSGKFPQNEIQDILLGLNISYNVIFFKSKIKMDTDENVSPDYEDILRNISRATGGFTLEVTDIKNGLLQLSQHKDISYLINIPVRRGNNLKIDIKARKGNYRTCHKKTYNKNEIERIIKFSTDKVKISDVSVKNKIVKFTLSNFSTDKSKVRELEGNLESILLIKNEKGDVIYKRSNILKTFKDTITIILPPLHNISGTNRVFIFAEDKITNLSIIFNRDFIF